MDELKSFPGDLEAFVVVILIHNIIRKPIDKKYQ